MLQSKDRKLQSVKRNSRMKIDDIQRESSKQIGQLEGSLQNANEKMIQQVSLR